MRTKLLSCELRRHLQAHLRQLHADVGVYLVLLNRIQQPVIDLRSIVRRFLRANAFPKRVKSHQHALPIQGPGDAECVVNLHPRHKA